MLEISLFPTYSLCTSACKIRKTAFSFCYRDSYNNVFPLSLSNEGFLKDERQIWNMGYYGLEIKCSFNIENGDKLYGTEGIACSDASIGLAIIWMSPSSKQRGVFPLGTIESSQASQTIEANLYFNKGELKGKLTLNSVLYISKAGNPVVEEDSLANEAGFIVGELDSMDIQLDDIIPVFPIFNVNSNGDPLWSVTCNWDDPKEDIFKEVFSININEAHKDYQFLDRTKKSFSLELFIEVLSSALCVFVEKLRTEADFGKFDNPMEGSVAATFNYFVSRLEWNINSPEELALSIRKNLEYQLKKQL